MDRKQIGIEMRAAIKQGDVERVVSLLDLDKNLIAMMTPFGTWLHVAATHGNLDIVKRLIASGADVNARGGIGGGTPLDQAASEGHVEIVEYLLSWGATLDVSEPEQNPLFGAIYGGHTKVAKLLIDRGIDIDAHYLRASKQVRNALSFARDCGRTEIADYLVSKGAVMPEAKPAEVALAPHEPTAEDKAHEQIISHMAELFGPVDPLAQQEIVPVHDKVHVAINVIRLNDRHPFLTLFTTGMSDQAMSVPKGQEEYRYAELLMHLPATWPQPRDKAAGEEALWPLEWLRKVAYYPHLNDTWLGGPMTIISSDDPPVPLGPNTKQTCLLLLAGVTDWNPLPLKDRRSVFFYTVIPIYTEERDFEKEHGIMPLVQRLKERGHTAVVDAGPALHRPPIFFAAD